MNRTFGNIKDLIAERGKCPLCNKDTVMEIVAKDLFSDYNFGLWKASTKNTTFSIKEKTGIIELHQNGISLNFDNGTIIFADAATCSATGAYVAFDFVLTCEHEHIGKAFECRGHFSFCCDDFDADWKGQIIYELNEVSMTGEVIVAYEVVDDTANVVKIINNYTDNKSIVSLAASNINGEFAPMFNKITKEALGEHFLKFKNPNKIMSRVNSLLFLQ
jgi:hypothetical protein